MVDPAFAKNQLDLMTREWYMKPDGALPAYEWNFNGAIGRRFQRVQSLIFFAFVTDVNPPVHAWATFRVFKIERKMFGTEDIKFLERVFQKLLINFTWFVQLCEPDGGMLTRADATGGSTAKTSTASAYSKAAFSVLITSVSSIDQKRFQLVSTSPQRI